MSTPPDMHAPQMIWDTLSQPQRDAAYNNNAAVANSPQWVAARDVAAEAFRAAHPAGLDTPYGPHERQKLDLFPAKNPSAPCLVFIHGGYWQKNSREVFAHYAEGLMTHGWSVAMAGYRLAPGARLSESVSDIGKALDFLASVGAEHGIAGPLVIAGWSAGAQLAVMHLHHPAVMAGLAISGVYELAPIRDTFLNAALDLSSTEIASLSPLRLRQSHSPLIVAYGTAEVPALVHDSRALSARRVEAGAPGALLPIPGADHFSILEQLRQPEGLLTRAVLDLVCGDAA
ncbi:alpha/beta hydrolase [Xanthobacter sp. TB0139]|uniref:alpha/beta hydrolase n=1 Tax=Xanthobacter sp. TB0139 TaxID=3459178 RepID=UPI004039591A